MKIFKKSIIGMVVILSVLMINGLSYSAAPTISSVTVNKGTNVVTIKGGNFEEGARVSLMKSGYPIIGSIDIQEPASGVYVSGNYAYVVTSENSIFDSWLQIIDISIPSAPKLTVSYKITDEDDGAAEFYVSGNYIYLLTFERFLNIIDISTPSLPKLTVSYKIKNDQAARSIYVSGNYAYVVGWSGHGSTIQAIDISDKSAPKLAGSYKIVGDGEEAKMVYVLDSYAYIACGLGLQIIDVSTPTALKLAGFYKTTGRANRVYVSGSYAYVTTGGQSGLQVIDIIDITIPSSPKFIGSYDNDTTSYLTGVYVYGRYADLSNSGLVSQGIDGIPPILAGFYDKHMQGDSKIGRVYVEGKYAYMMNVVGYGDDSSRGSLQVIDISILSSQKNAASYDLTKIKVSDPTTITAEFPSDMSNGDYNVLVTSPDKQVGRYLYHYEEVKEKGEKIK